MACRTCFAGVWKVFFRRQIEGGFAAPEDDSTAAMYQDEAALLAQVEEALPHLLKFNSKGWEERSLSYIGLLHFCSRMMMDIPEGDLKRLFAEHDEDGDGALNVKELFEAAKKTSFFGNLVLVVLAAADFRVGKDYDYSKSTFQNYVVCDGGDKAAGASVDSTHVDPRLHSRRVGWHESILRRWLPKRSPQKEPWLILGLALPQALPNQVLAWLYHRNILPIGGMVEVSYDLFTQVIPELPLYIDRHGGYSTGSAFVRQEAELLERKALRALVDARQHVWMPCLPGETRHAISIVEGLQGTGYRIAVFDFRIDESVVLLRRKAMRKTGRALQVSTGSQIPLQDEVELLRACANICARIECNEDIPILSLVEFANVSGCWPVLRHCFEAPKVHGLDQAAKFPRALRPLYLARMKAGSLLIGQAKFDPCLELEVLHFGPETGFSDSAAKLVDALPAVKQPVRLALSSVCKGLFFAGDENETKKDVLPGAADEITSFAWLHGFGSTGNHLAISLQFLRDHQIAISSPMIAILTVGCIVHFNNKGRPLFIDIPSNQKSQNSLHFGAPSSMSARSVAELGLRWKAVSEEELRKGGAEHECWLNPGETIDGRSVVAGGFAYKLSPEVAAAVGSDAIYFEVLHNLDSSRIQFS